jgi:hypothetical protein
VVPVPVPMPVPMQILRRRLDGHASAIDHTQSGDACDQRLMTREEFLLEEHLIKRALKAANGLIRFLESTPDPPLPRWKPKPPKAP